MHALVPRHGALHSQLSLLSLYHGTAQQGSKKQGARRLSRRYVPTLGNRWSVLWHMCLWMQVRETQWLVFVVQPLGCSEGVWGLKMKDFVRFVVVMFFRKASPLASPKW